MKKLLWLWMFGLCLSFANPTQVKAAGVPQITLTVPEKATLKTQNMEAKLSVTSNTLSESDFTDDKKQRNLRLILRAENILQLEILKLIWANKIKCWRQWYIILMRLAKMQVKQMTG